jgi:hypothetical protein
VAPTSTSFELQVQVEGGGKLIAEYVGLPNRNPAASGDFVGAWTTSFSGQPAVQAQVHTSNGRALLQGLQIPEQDYVIGYSVGPDPKGASIAALVPLVNGQVGESVSISVSIAEVSSTTVAVEYVTPPGDLPRTFGHSLALVSGQVFQPGVPPLAEMAMQSDQSSGVVAFGGVIVQRRQWYTVAYLAGPEPANLAATTSFQVDA